MLETPRVGHQGRIEVLGRLRGDPGREQPGQLQNHASHRGVVWIHPGRVAPGLPGQMMIQINHRRELRKAVEERADPLRRTAVQDDQAVEPRGVFELAYYPLCPGQKSVGLGHPGMIVENRLPARLLQDQPQPDKGPDSVPVRIDMGGQKPPPAPKKGPGHGPRAGPPVVDESAARSHEAPSGFSSAPVSGAMALRRLSMASPRSRESS